MIWVLGIIFLIFGLIYFCLCLFNPNWYWKKLIVIMREEAILKHYGRQKARYIIGFVSIIFIIMGLLLILIRELVAK